MKTTVAEVCWNLADKAEPTRYQETAVAAEGPEPTVLRMYGVGRSIVMKGRRPFGNCRRTVLCLRNRHPPGCHR